MQREAELLQQLQSGDRNGLIGDDVAFLPPVDRPVVTVDQQIEGVHFVAGLAAQQVARRLLAVNLSDIAAAGAEPRFAWLALATPPDYDRLAFIEALREAATGYDVALAGGDLSRAGRVHASLTLLGALTPERHEMRRSNGRPGDRLWLGGAVGLAAIGRVLVARGARLSDGAVRWPESLQRIVQPERFAERCVRQHLEPQPQLELGRWLAGRQRCAALDVSDGLTLDLHRLAQASGVDAVLDDAPLPESRHAAALARSLGEDFDALALSGGEDYVLLFALPPTEMPPAELGAVAIGELVAAGAVAGTLWRQSGAGREVIPPAGWDHFGDPTE